MTEPIYKRRSINLDDKTYKIGKLLAKEKPCLYQHCCGLSSMRPTNNSQEIPNHKIAVALVNKERRMGTDQRLPVPLFQPIILEGTI